MKDNKIKQFFYRLFVEDFDSKLKSAKKTHNMIISSTEGKLNHFYNDKGGEIRGYYRRQYKFANTLPTHPLIVKYQ